MSLICMNGYDIINQHTHQHTHFTLLINFVRNPLVGRDFKVSSSEIYLKVKKIEIEKKNPLWSAAKKGRTFFSFSR